MKEITKRILHFRDERGWKPYHDPKDLAISISLEANELLENFQWKSTDQALQENEQNIKEEMADVMIYLVQLADKLNIDLEKEVADKLVKNAMKYPVT